MEHTSLRSYTSSISYRPPRISNGVFVYLKLLLIFDLIVIGVTVFNRISRHICDYSFHFDDFFNRPCIYRSRFLHHLLPRVETLVTTMHFYLIAALTTHRYWKIARPFQSRLYDTKRRSYSILVSLLLIIVTFRLPTFVIELKLVAQPILRIDIDHWQTVIMTKYRFVYHSIINPIISQLLPFVWTTVFSALTLAQVYRRAKDGPMLHEESTTIISARNSLLSGELRRVRLSHSTTVRRHKSYERSEIRATLFIASIVNICLVCYSVQLYMIARKWHLLLSGSCPIRFDFLISSIETVLEIVSTSVNVFVFTAFTSQMANSIIGRAKIIADISSFVSLLKSSSSSV